MGNSMRFMFDGRKAAQAAAYLVQLNGGRMNYMVLIKLLYLGDRQALIDIGAPITGDRMVAMPHGPVLSRTYDLINMGAPEAGGPCPWYEYLSEPADYEVKLKKAPETDELSKYELGLLGDIYAKFGRMSKWALRDYAHTLPEWDDPRGSSFGIDQLDILRSSGRTEAEIAEMQHEAEETWFMKTLDMTRR
ncbi:MAG: Panacea domain-containing protein [Tepidiformaceae bacterium]